MKRPPAPRRLIRLSVRQTESLLHAATIGRDFLGGEQRATLDRALHKATKQVRKQEGKRDPEP
jgi:hypothetical protein